MDNLRKYDECIRVYNDICDKLDEIGAGHELFIQLNQLCNMALDINMDAVKCEMRKKQM